MEKTLEGGITLDNRELFYIADALREIVKYEGQSNEDSDGLYIHNTWLTPETCYHIANLIETLNNKPIVGNKEIEMLRKGQYK